MNNSNILVDLEKINSQLEKADKQKSRLIRSIYREYEIYLSLIRDLLYISVKKGIYELCSYPSVKDKYLNANEFSCLFEKKISKVIYINLPLFTVEQLKINNIEKKINKGINFNLLGSSSKIMEEQKEKFQYEDSFNQFEEPSQFEISEDTSYTSEYYQSENHEKFASLDLDKNYPNNYLSRNNIFENIGVEKQFISSLIELIGEVKVENPRDSENENINQKEFFPKYESFQNFELIDNSLEYLLLNISYKINQILFKANLIKRMISHDSFVYLVGKNLMIKHPHPFVINFELNINQVSSKVDNFPSITFFNVSTVELEFKNLNLSIQRNKINELKNQFQRLIKKETYWRQKEKTLNKIR